MNLAVSFTSQLCSQIFSEENVERSKSVVSILKHNYYESGHVPSTNSPMSDVCPSTSEGSTSSVTSITTPLYDVFLGGSCGNTVWRRQLVIPFLKKRAITYYDPQRSVWSENMIYEESIAKENSSLFLFVLDPATVNATSFLEIAYFAARKAPKLLVVFLGKSEWREKAHPEDLPDRLTTCQLLDRILHAHHVPMLHSIQDALDYIEEEIIGGKKWAEALAHPRHRLPFLHLRTKRFARNAGVQARFAWGRIRSGAGKALVAGCVDSAVLVSCHLALPHVSIFFVLVPLVALNVLIFGTAAAWRRLRGRHPRSIGDSSTRSLPLPRLATTPLLPQAAPRKVDMKRSRKVLDAIESPSVLPLPFASSRRPNGRRRLELGETLSHDVYLASSSTEELSWVNDEAVPTLSKHGVSYSTVLACDSLPPESRMAVLMKGSRHYKQLLYYVPSTKTFLSGMVEIAYLLGHANWQVTVCVPRESEQLEAEEGEDECERSARRRRNDCYAIAFCYLRDMAKRRQSHVFSSLPEALDHVRLTAARDAF